MKRQRRKLVDVDEVGQLLAWDVDALSTFTWDALTTFDVDAQDLQWSDWYELSNATDVAQQKGIVE